MTGGQQVVQVAAVVFICGAIILLIALSWPSCPSITRRILGCQADGSTTTTNTVLQLNNSSQQLDNSCQQQLLPSDQHQEDNGKVNGCHENLIFSGGQLSRSEEQLSGSEVQLSCSDRQLSSSEEQLSGYKQQLCGTEEPPLGFVGDKPVTGSE
jgi:hypothetical protein